jgi:hydroxyethylthiazole kinase-like uncharacterized protein yjeF
MAMTALLTNQEMAEADRLTIAGGVSGWTLMRAAGQAVADVAADHAGAGRVLVVCGTGNNGGDGFVAAKLLAQAGRDVEVMLVGSQAALKGDAALAAVEWRGPVIGPDPQACARAGLIIDALFGAGLDRNVTGIHRVIVEAINASGAHVIAVDLASGINGSTGEVMGVAVRARQSVTFFRRKPGHLLFPGRDYCGEVLLADIGIRDDVLSSIKPRTFENGPDLWGARFPVPRRKDHKYSRGATVVVSGGMSSTGAARLAARGALRAGSGLVTLATPREALAVNAAASTAVMVHAVDTPEELSRFLDDPRRNCCVIGPGLGVGARTRDMVTAVLMHPCAAVLDADALTSYAGQQKELFSFIKKISYSQVILTPHDGEFKRLFSELSGFDKLHSRLEKARLAAEVSGAHVILKGPDTVVASPDGRAAIAANAPPWLATAGSGDVLAGFVGGLLAQGMAAFEAACAAVWLHGEAGRLAGPGLISEDLPEMLPEVFRALFAKFGAAN